MQQYRQIALGVTRHAPTAPAGATPLDDSALADLRRAVFERDDFTCGWCGFRAKRYQDVRYLNGNALDQRTQNMATICLFCAQCFALEGVSERRSGSLVWLPEFDQAQLNHLARAIYIARITSGAMADAARMALDALMQRREEAAARLGTDDTGVLATVLQDLLEDYEYEVRGAKLDGIRLLPHDRRIIREGDLEFNQFPQILAYWRSKDGPFGGSLPASWADNFLEVQDAVGAKLGADAA